MQRKENMPLMVYVGLLGINSRLLAWGFVWLCLTLAMVSLGCGFVINLGLAGAIVSAVFAMTFVGCAAWYWYAIKWVDRYSAWEKA